MPRAFPPHQGKRRNAARSLAAFGKGGALFAAGNKIKKIIRAEPFGSARVFCILRFSAAPLRVCFRPAAHKNGRGFFNSFPQSPAF